DTLELGQVGFSKMQSAFAVARSLGASVSTAYAIHAGVAMLTVSGLILAVRRPISTAMQRSLIVIACLLITPFSFFYDMVIVALPLAWMLSEWQKQGFPSWSKLVLVAVFLTPALHLLCGPLPFGLPMLLLFGALLLRLVPAVRGPSAFAWLATRAA